MPDGLITLCTGSTALVMGGAVIVLVVVTAAGAAVVADVLGGAADVVAVVVGVAFVPHADRTSVRIKTRHAKKTVRFDLFILYSF